MAEQKQVPDVIKRRYDESIAGIVTTLQWVIIALILAFIFRCFVVEAFRIPTGSMAETLSGAHYHIQCDMCGFKYDLGESEDREPEPKCPNCGYEIPSETALKPSNGDRIFVHKCHYQFSDPKRWDVVVFRYPSYPRDNYIKRLIGLPGEAVEIIDGDIYIDSQIQRKPPKVQQELWMPLFNSDFIPYTVNLQEEQKPEDFHWKLPFVNDEFSRWDISDPSRFVLDSDAKLHTINFDSEDGEKFKSYYAYNNTTRFRRPPVCSDFKVQFCIEKPGSYVSVILGKYGRLYQASLDSQSVASIEMVNDGKVERLQSKKISLNSGGFVRFEFSNVDHMLTLKINDEVLQNDLELVDDSIGDREANILPQISIVGSGKLALEHVAVFRDSHYVSKSGIRAVRGKPFVLGEDEFFMCGDNSMDSWDCRMWALEGKGNYIINEDGERVLSKYRPGVVPKEYLVGKAFYLYWGNAFAPFDNMLRVIPNFTESKRVYGGTDTN